MFCAWCTWTLTVSLCIAPQGCADYLLFNSWHFFLIFACVSIVCNSSTNRFIFLSDGSGLTGVFIALDLLLRQVLSKNSIDIRDVVLSLRNNRPQMVRTLVSKSIYWMRLNDKLYIHYFILKTYYKIQIIINDILAKLKSLAARLMVN